MQLSQFQIPIQSLSIARVDDFGCRFQMLHLDTEYSGKFGGTFWLRAGTSI